MKLGQSDPRNRVTTERTDRAVSPVIGVILMVAITVILAAVIGVFVLGLGDELGESQPTATVGFEESEIDGQVELVHSSGDTITLNDQDYTVLVDGTPIADPDWDVGGGDEVELGPGESTTIDLGTAEAEAGETQTVALRHESSDSILTSDDIVIEEEQ